MLKSRLLLGAVSFSTLVMTVPAVAKPAKHAAASSSAAELKALREQIEILTARLDAQEAATLQTQSTTREVQAQAATAQAQAEAATAATATVPTQVKTAMAANAPKAAAAAWFNDTSISGRMYFNASNINQQLNGAKTASTGTGFNIKRFYLGVDHKFDKMFSANLTMDVSNVVGRTSSGNFSGNTVGVTLPPVGAPGAPQTAGVTQSDYGLVGKGFYIKKAYLQAKFDPALTVRLGAADMPWVPYVEGIYGYRHIENTLADRTSFATSSDWGVHVLGDLADGIVSYQVSVVDGGTYRNVKVTRSVDVEGRVSVAYKGFFGAVGGYTGKLGNNVQSVTTTPTTFRTASRFDGLIGYKNKLFTIGGEYFYAKNYASSNTPNYITSPILSDKAEGYSGFASVNFMPQWSAFGRYDHLKPTKDVIPGRKDDYFNVGVQYSPAKIVDLALVYKRDTANGGVINTSNGSIGAAGVNNRGTYDEFGLFGQFRF
ncbi:hypothetical protein [Sphingomonas sp.]|uniref:hypothetical protein n=1 Tax=Sphingomonas sp. TaxID=28214 RepID=UPI0025CF2180|nr:hypothetical protein [Sphingomonas sp.]